MLALCCWGVSIFFAATSALTVFQKMKHFLAAVTFAHFPLNRGLGRICSLVWSRRCSDKKQLFCAAQMAHLARCCTQLSDRRDSCSIHRRRTHPGPASPPLLQPFLHFTATPSTISASVAWRQTSYFSTNRRFCSLPWGQKAKPHEWTVCLTREN